MTSAPQSAQSHARIWATLFQHTSDVALLLDAEGVVVGASQRATALLGPLAKGVALRSLIGGAPYDKLAGPVELDGTRFELTQLPVPGESGQTGYSMLILAPIAATEPLDWQQERRLHEVTQAISSALDIEEMLNRVLRLSVELIGADAATLPLYDPERDRMQPAHVVNIVGPLSNQYRGSGTVWDVVDTGQSSRDNGYGTNPRALPRLLEMGIHAVLAVPVAAGRQILGVLIMYHWTPGKRFSARDQELMEIVGRQAGVALQNARLYAAAVREADRRTLLYKASVALGSAVTTGELYATIHRTAASLMRCDSCIIALLDEPRQEIEYVYMADGEQYYPPERVPIWRGLLGYVMRSGVSLRLTNCDDEVDVLFGAEQLGEGDSVSRSIIAVVLTVAERTIGAITVQSAHPEAYSAADLDAMETLAATAAIAIRNAQLFARVQELATRDALTGVFNRRHFYDLARRELERAARYPHPLSLLMLDIDYFKRINDTYGHLAGDQVLQAVTVRCREALREVDVVARYGGEEFLVLLPETPRAAALLAAERLREQIGRAPVETDVGAIEVSVSIGVAGYEAERLGSVDELLDQVDRALYEAKRAGRDQVRSYLDPRQALV